MSIILPYDASLETATGAFISPSGKIYPVNGNHEKFARDYCLGEEYKRIPEQHYGQPYHIYRQLLVQAEYERMKKNPDLLSTSHLNKHDLCVLKFWLKNHQDSRIFIYSDFLVFLLSFDKVEDKLRRYITTTSLEPHYRFFNYYLMDWTIDCREKIRLNNETGTFDFYESDILFRDNRDRDAEEEILELKKQIPLEDRHFFLK